MFVRVDKKKSGTAAFIIIQPFNVMQIYFPLSWKWIMNTDKNNIWKIIYPIPHKGLFTKQQNI